MKFVKMFRSAPIDVAAPGVVVVDSALAYERLSSRVAGEIGEVSTTAMTRMISDAWYPEEEQKVPNPLLSLHGEKVEDLRAASMVAQANLLDAHGKFTRDLMALGASSEAMALGYAQVTTTIPYYRPADRVFVEAASASAMRISPADRAAHVAATDRGRSEVGDRELRREAALDFYSKLSTIDLVSAARGAQVMMARELTASTNDRDTLCRIVTLGMAARQGKPAHLAANAEALTEASALPLVKPSRFTRENSPLRLLVDVTGDFMRERARDRRAMRKAAEVEF